jgi:putative endonuclease
VKNYSVYILYSSKLDRYYTGTTDDVERRLAEHNSGSYEKAFTQKGIPWVLYLFIEGLESRQAYEMERHIKSMKSRKYIENLKENTDFRNRLRERFGS